MNTNSTTEYEWSYKLELENGSNVQSIGLSTECHQYNIFYMTYDRRRPHIKGDDISIHNLGNDEPIRKITVGCKEDVRVIRFHFQPASKELTIEIEKKEFKIPLKDGVNYYPFQVRTLTSGDLRSSDLRSGDRTEKYFSTKKSL